MLKIIILVVIPFMVNNFHKKYKDWDDPINFQVSKNPYKKIKYDDL